MLFMNIFKSRLTTSKMKILLHQSYGKLKDIAFDDLPASEVSPATIRKSFKENKLTYEEGFTCFIIKCSFCCNENKSRLYVNKTTGLFMCSSCKTSGQWDKLQSYFSINKGSKKWKTIMSMQTDIDELKELNKALVNINNTTIQLKTLENSEINDISTKFKLPNLSNNNLDIRIDETRTSLFFPLEDVESSIAGYRKIHSSPSIDDSVIPSGTYGGLLTNRVPKSKDTAVLVPNISDFLILSKAKINVNVVCLPNHVKNLPQYYLPSLERFKKLILWFGWDGSAWYAARNFAKKLGEKRCYIVRSCDTQNLPHIDNSQDFKTIISNAQPIYHKSITTFAHLRSDVLSELQNNEIIEGVKWKRYPSLNKILKGHRRGELTVITGPTGSGKTTFISDYSLDLAMQGVNTLWGSFEIRNSRLAKTMLQQMAGFPLTENMERFDEIADIFETLPIYFMTFHGQQSIKVVMEAVEHATYVHDIAHVIVDNLQFMLGVSDSDKIFDRFAKQDAVVASFRQFATRKNCHVTLVIHPRKERDEDLTASSIFGGAKASQEADNILIIQDKRLMTSRGKRFLQIVKNRYSGDLGVFPMEFNKASLSFQQKKKDKKTEESEPDR